ncbi:SigB/SigF/SigG family RNA polymerase sigma factor [Nocardia callitridis]|uniref:SigB/SigF/SigG family RNA polymerase sigma factor n=1 Tax=Nocardia callitridis TaxID=648753 RepID=A0ABP9KMQ3_9NOCA
MTREFTTDRNDTIDYTAHARTDQQDKAGRGRHTEGYENLEPVFAELAALDPGDPRRPRLRAEILRECLPLAEHIARRFAGRGESFDDLHQVARVGLVLAVDRYEVARGSAFVAFAVPTVMGEVRRYFRDSTWSLRVPRRLKEIQQLIGPATERLSHRTGRMPTAREIAEELGLEVGAVTQALVAANAYRTKSIDAVTREDDSSFAPIAETVGADEPCYGLVEQAITVRPLLAELPKRDRQVLIMRYFETKTQTQIADRLGVSQMQVSRILSRTLRDLRARADGTRRAASRAA